MGCSYGMMLIFINQVMKQKYCLESIVPFKSINQSLSNKSKTKQTFSFSKALRFQPNQPKCPISSYRGNEFKARNEGAIIGYGNKLNVTLNTAVSPGSSRYHIKSIFDSNKMNNKGYTLSLSRQNVAHNSYINGNNLKLPGVGRYHLQTQTAIKNNKAPVYSMRIKTRMLDLTRTIEPQNNNPSPAHYQNNPERSSSLYGSRFKRLSYSGSRSKRFFNSDNRVPGPGQYQNPTDLSSVGKYVKSSHHGGTNAKFDTSKRVTKFDTTERRSRELPGPGDYRQSSQFGQYDGDVYQRSASKNTLTNRF